MCFMDSCDQLMSFLFFFDRDNLTFNVWLLGKGVHETTSLKCLGQVWVLFCVWWIFFFVHVCVEQVFLNT